MKPTKEQIKSEIAALEACKSYVPRFTAFGENNHSKLDLQIEYLKDGIDTTAGEFYDYTADEQSSILEAQYWEEGESGESPSSGWDSFKPKETKKMINPQTKKEP